MIDESVCSVCARLTGFGDEDKGEPPVNLARCPAPGSMECRAVAQAVAPWRRENETLRANSDHLSSENASLASQVESMAMRIESLAEELAKPEDVRLREVIDALDGRAVIFDGLGARVGHLLDEIDEWIARAGEAERLAEERLAHANQLQADIEAEQQGRLALRKRLGARDNETMGAFLERLAAAASAARFFYSAKVSKADRGEGNNHPTVKPTALMRYLCRLVTPPGGIVLDPFMGSGSTGKAAKLEGFDFIGIEREKEYFDIAQTRIKTNEK